MVWIKCVVFYLSVYLCLSLCVCVCICFHYLLDVCTLSLSLSFTRSHIPEGGWQWHKHLYIVFLSIHLNIFSSLCFLSHFYISVARLHLCPVMGLVMTKWSYNYHFLMHDFFTLHVILLSRLSQPIHYLVHPLWIISGSQPYCISLLPFCNILSDISPHTLTEGVGSLYSISKLEATNVLHIEPQSRLPSWEYGSLLCWHSLEESVASNMLPHMT